MIFKYIEIKKIFYHKMSFIRRMIHFHQQVIRIKNNEGVKINLSVKDTGVRILSEALSINTSLKELFIYDVNSDQVKYLADALEVNSSLKLLSFKFSNIGDIGASFFI